MMCANIYAIDQVIPVLSPEAFVHPQAIIIGDVIIESGCYIGPGACLRGDFSRIHIGNDSNVQENCVIHSFPQQDVIIEQQVTIAHGAILHGCYIEKNALIGMNAVIMDGVRIGSSSWVGAQSLLSAGQQIAANKLVLGSPAKVVRDLSTKEHGWQQSGLNSYLALTKRCLKTMHQVSPLSRIEAQRPRLNVDAQSIAPLHQS